MSEAGCVHAFDQSCLDACVSLQSHVQKMSIVLYKQTLLLDMQIYVVAYWCGSVDCGNANRFLEGLQVLLSTLQCSSDLRFDEHKQLVLIHFLKIAQKESLFLFLSLLNNTEGMVNECPLLPAWLHSLICWFHPMRNHKVCIADTVITLLVDWPK